MQRVNEKEKKCPHPIEARDCDYCDHNLIQYYIKYAFGRVDEKKRRCAHRTTKNARVKERKEEREEKNYGIFK